MTRDEVEANHKGVVVVDGFDDAIICVKDGSVHYDVEKCIQTLMDVEEMPREDAVDWFYYNVVGAYYGNDSPTWVEEDKLFEEKFQEQTT